MTQISTSLPKVEGHALDDFDLDIEFIEVGGTVEHIITMTESTAAAAASRLAPAADPPLPLMARPHANPDR